MSDDLSESMSNSVSGSVILFFGNSVALLFSAIGVILVALMLSPSEYGLFSITLVLPGMLILFSDWGVNKALIRYIAQYRSINKLEDVKDLAMAGYFFKFLIGTVLSLFLFLFGDFFAVFLIRRPEVGEFIRLTSVLVLSQSMYTTANSIFAGFEKMNYRATLNIIQSVVKAVISPLLVYLNYGVSGVVIGHTLSFFIAAIIGFISLRSLFNLSISFQYERLKENVKLLLIFGMPLFLGNILLGFAMQFRGVLLSWFVSAEMIGNYSISSWFITYFSILTSAVGVNLFSTFSKYSFDDKTKKVTEIFHGSIRYSSMFLIPLACMLIVISEPFVYTLFSEKYPQAPLLLSLRLVPMLFIGVGSMSNIVFLNSQGDTRASSRIMIISSFVSFFLSLIFIYLWNIMGLVFSYIISSFVQNLIGFIVVRRKYGVGPNFNYTCKVVFCSFISGGLAYGFLWFFSTLPLIELFISVFIFLLCYLFLAPFIGVLERRDITLLDSLFFNLKRIYPFVRFILNVEEKILKYKSR